MSPGQHFIYVFIMMYHIYVNILIVIYKIYKKIILLNSTGLGQYIKYCSINTTLNILQNICNKNIYH